MFDVGELKNKIAVIGVGNTKYGNFPEIDDYGLAAHAFRNAVNDCGIDKNKIDGILVSRIPYYGAHGGGAGDQPALDDYVAGPWSDVGYRHYRSRDRDCSGTLRLRCVVVCQYRAVAASELRR